MLELGPLAQYSPIVATGVERFAVVVLAGLPVTWNVKSTSFEFVDFNCALFGTMVKLPLAVGVTVLDHVLLPRPIVIPKVLVLNVPVNPGYEPALTYWG